MKKLAFVAIVALFLAACQSDQDSDDVDDIDMEQEPVVEQTPPNPTRRRYQPRKRPEPEPEMERLEPRQQLVPQYIEGRLDQDGPGLDLMIDASSMDAFHQSLELIASETSESQYRSLAGAVDMLGFYDMEAQGVEGLLMILNGMTGEEVIERAHKIRYGQ